MARYDKYEPFAGGFRAPLAADFVTPANFNKLIGVGLDVNGRVVIGAGQTGVLGVMVLTARKYAGAVVDVMTGGEVVEFDPAGPVLSGGSYVTGALSNPGTVYYANNAGVVSTTTTGVRIGHTVAAGRLVVRVEATQGAGSA